MRASISAGATAVFDVPQIPSRRVMTSSSMESSVIDTLSHYLNEVADCGEKPFLRLLSPGQPDSVLTFAALRDECARAAHFYQAQGCAPQDTVLVILPHSTELVTSFFGAIFAGLVPSILAVPSFKIDRDVYRHEIQALVTRIGARGILGTSEVFESAGLSSAGLADCQLWDASDLRAHQERLSGPVAVSPENVALLQHSSGSTGLKKGVALRHTGILNQVRHYAAAIRLRQSDLFASWLPLYHDMGLVSCLLMPMVTRNTVVMLSPFDWVRNPVSLLRAITEHRAQLCWLPNFAYNFMAKRVTARQAEGLDLSSMRAFINCSEPTMAESHRQFLERYGPHGVRPDMLWTSYAMAENTFAVTQTPAAEPARVERVARLSFQERHVAEPAQPGEPALEFVSAGYPIDGTRIRVVGPDRQDLGPRHVGEIAIAGDCLFESYFQLPEATREVLANGWYYSGDLGFQADGQLYITGRCKDLLIINGKNYYPQDIEGAVSVVDGIHDGRVVALSRPSPETGTELLIVIAEWEDHDDRPAEEAVRDALGTAVRAAVAARLECVIDDLRLVPRGWLLKTSSGKIARRPNLEKYLHTFVDR